MSKNVLKNRRHAFLEPKAPSVNVCIHLIKNVRLISQKIKMNLYSWKRGNVDIFYFKEIKFEGKQ